MKDEFFELKKTIKDLVGSGLVFYVPSYGNYSDAMISHSTLLLFKDIKIKFTQISAIDVKIALKALALGATFIFGGGKKWSKEWGATQNIVNNALLLKKINRSINIIILPSTYEYPYKLSKVLAFSRDKNESLVNVPSAKFCPDMAFYIDDMNVVPTHVVGYFFRKDNQSANVIDIPKENIDIINSGSSQKSLKIFYQKLTEYGIIYTDSLHVAIAACHIGREVHLYPDFSFKNEAVYECSLRDNFKNVYFHEDFKFTSPITPPFLM